MARLLTILSLILVLLLFPPATLALISNNAVPGDVTYPIKRGFEDIIYAVASVHPVSKAWFSAARSERRFEEVNILVTKGKQIDQTLNELVEQTQIAASQIVQITDKNQKTQLVEKLSQSIKTYDEGLAELPPQETVIPPTVAPAPTIKPTSTPRPTATPHPTSIPQPAPTPTPPPPPSPPSSKCDEIKEPIEKARCELERIRVGLGAQSQDAPRQENRGDGKDENRGGGKDQKDEDKQNRHNRQKSDEKQDNKDNREDDNRDRGGDDRTRGFSKER